MSRKKFTKVIAGSLKNKAIQLPPDIGGVKSITTAKMKEAAMSMLNHYAYNFQNSIFYDLFAGSGQMGIEALSRGVDAGVFIEWDAHTVSFLKKTLSALNLNDKTSVHRKDGVRTIKSAITQKSELPCAQNARTLILFADPPYGHERNGRLLSDLVLSHFQKYMEQKTMVYEQTLLLLQVPVPKTRDISPKVYDRMVSTSTSHNTYGKNALLLFQGH